MNKEPFIITVNENDMPNLAKDGADSFGFTFDKTSEWNHKQQEIVPLLVSVNEKLDIIIKLLAENGRG